MRKKIIFRKSSTNPAFLPPKCLHNNRREQGEQPGTPVHVETSQKLPAYNVIRYCKRTHKNANRGAPRKRTPPHTLNPQQPRSTPQGRTRPRATRIGATGNPDIMPAAHGPEDALSPSFAATLLQKSILDPHNKPAKKSPASR